MSLSFLDFDLARMGVVYFHLVACCIAIGTIFMSDLRLVRRLANAEPASIDHEHLDPLQTIIGRALLALWITGAMLVGMDIAANGASVLLNPKLQAKIGIVLLLTLNGIALHRSVLPALKRVSCLRQLAPAMRQFAMFTGAVSAVSWLYAAGLGIGRPLNWKYSLGQILAAYPMFILGGFMTMALLVAWAARRQHVGKARVTF